MRTRGRARGLGVGAAQDVLAARRRAAHAACGRAPALRLAVRVRRQQLRAVLALAAGPLLEANRTAQKHFQRVSHVLLQTEHASHGRHRGGQPPQAEETVRHHPPGWFSQRYQFEKNSDQWCLRQEKR